MKKSKNIMKRIGLWAIVVVTLVSSVGLSSAFAASQANVAVKNAQDLIKQAAQAQVVAYTFAKCMKYRDGEGDYDRSIDANNIKEGYWFSSNVAATRVATGAWLESQVQGDYYDGKIVCNDKNKSKQNGITQAFVNTLSSVSSDMDIVCNKHSDSGNGHLSGGIFKHYNDEVCEDLDAGVYYKIDEAASKAYIGELYEEAMQGNDYAKAWGEIDTYDSATGYFLYKQDFETACFDEYLDDNNNVTTFSKKVKVVQDDGSIVEKYVKPQKNKNDNASSGWSFAGEEEKTCGGLIDKMNDYATSYQEALFKAIRGECGSQASQEALAAKIAEYEEKAGSNGLSEEETAELNQLREIQSSGNYTQATAGGGLECISTSSFSVVMDDPASENSENSENNEQECYRGAGSLGWIMCPVVMATNNLVEWLYDKIEKNFLQVNANLLFDDNNGVTAAWATFRNLANILFVIFLLFVVFSQLTGFGIDNYGIKKMLPRLIIGAIMVNLSLIACEIAIDISNILGASLKGLFESGFNLSYGEGASAMATGSGAVFDLAVVAAIVFVNPATVATVFLFLISMTIAVLFLWLILVARQAGIVICVVISPIMLVFSLLPNTEKISRKWFDIMKGLLLLYPICGLVVGGGKMAGAILSNIDGDSWWKVAAMVVQVIPYFVIPSLLRGSLNAVNGLGDKLGNMGSRGQQGAFRRMNNSELADRAKARMNSSNFLWRRSAANAASRTKVGKVLAAPLNNSIVRAQNKKDEYRAKDEAASKTMQQAIFEAAEKSDQRKIKRDQKRGIDTTTDAYQDTLKSTAEKTRQRFEQAIDSKNEELANSLIDVYQRQTSASKAAEMVAEVLDKKQEDGILGGANRTGFMRRMADKHASMLEKAPDLEKYLRTGGIDSQGNRMGFNNNATSYLQRGDGEGLQIGDLKDSQVVSAGSNAIARMIANGQLTQAQAQRIMSNKDARDKMDDVQQLLLGAYAQNGASAVINTNGGKATPQQAAAQAKQDAETALRKGTGFGGLDAKQVANTLEWGGETVIIRKP